MGSHGDDKRIRTAGGGPLARIIRRNSAPSVGVYLREVARASIAASLMLGASGCSQLQQGPGGGGVDAGPDARIVDAAPDAPEGIDAAGPPFAEFLCEGGSPLLVQGIDAATDVDYLAAYEAQPFELPTSTLVDAVGTPCATATDMEACLATLDGREDEWRNHLVTTTGDDVGVLVDGEEVRAFVGPVDTPQEAVLLAWHAGYRITCDEPEQYGVREVDGGYEVLAIRTSDCPIERHRVLLFVASDGTVEELASEVIERTEACVGRRPPGLRPADDVPKGEAVGLHFATVARLEASAVIAFDLLARELEALGAPAELVDQARSAARDEIRHAETMTGLARRFGQEPLRARVEPGPPRSLRELAFDNAAEGCVRETFGALVGAHQAGTAADGAVAEAMRTIAEDETRHAELSWAIAAWAEPQLSAADRVRLEGTRRRAVLDLRAEVGMHPDPHLASVAGLPSAAVAVAMVDRLARDLWS
jgi:hypothetical protein